MGQMFWIRAEIVGLGLKLVDSDVFFLDWG